MLRQELKLLVEEPGARVRIEGVFHMAPEGNPNSYANFEGRVLGYVSFSLNRLVRFDLVALGDSRGTTDWSEKGGRYPVGIAFELAKGDSPLDRMIPLHLPENPSEYFAP